MSSSSGNYEETAVPTLKVMRLQSPDLDQPTGGTLESKCYVGLSLSLPDSFGVIHVGEKFTAYLGAVNASKEYYVRRLTVNAQLQTPSHRWPLPSKLDGTVGIDVSPGDAVDAIVSKALEESGQHILRVEVGYVTSEGINKTLRKFYRFNVANPLSIKELTVRSGDSACFVSLAVENVSSQVMTISLATFEAASGLVSEAIGEKSAIKSVRSTPGTRRRAVDLFDTSGRLMPKASCRYLFKVSTLETPRSSARGIACGDDLGKALFEWKKTMGEAGRMATLSIKCPMAEPPNVKDNNPSKLMMGTGNRFVVDRSGLSVDVAAVAAQRAAGKAKTDLDQVLPVTVEPIDPPKTMKLAEPTTVQFLVVNHSPKAMMMQFQFRLNLMSGVAVSGTSYKNLGEIPGHGGSIVVTTKLIALVAGMLRVQGCCILNQSKGVEIPQPPLFHVFVGISGPIPQQ